MADGPIWRLRVSEQLDEAARAWCDKHNVSLSDLIRTGVATTIKAPSLLETIRKPGRPVESQ